MTKFDGTAYRTNKVSLECLSDILHAVQLSYPCLPVLAIHWIQLQHPLYPEQEEILKDLETQAHRNVTEQMRSLLLSAATYLRSYSSSVKWALLLSLRLSRMRWAFRREMTVLSQESFDVVTKTWCMGPERAADDSDFYFGDFQRRLANRGVRMLLLCGNSRPTDWKEFARAHTSTSGLCRLPEQCLLSPLAPLKMVFWQLWAAFRLLYGAVRERDPLLKWVFKLASASVLSPQTLTNSLYYWIGRSAAKTWRPRVFATLYEGRSWERCIRWGVKTVMPSCITAGYQHAAVYPYALSVLRPFLDEKYLTPDLVLCLGEQTRNMMQSGHRPCKSNLIVFGSFRRTPKEESQTSPLPRRRAVLVLPEGHFFEPRMLFDFTMKLAVRMPDHRFILRCHPAMPFDVVRPQMERAPEACSNVEVSSNRDINDDLKRSSVVLYRGTSAVMYTILKGLKPFYLHIPGQPEIDPLLELNTWRERISFLEEAEGILGQYAVTDPLCVLEQWQSAVDYVNRYILPVDECSITRFLAALGQGEEKLAG